jgi:hypothetical protein
LCAVFAGAAKTLFEWELDVFFVLDAIPRASTDADTNPGKAEGRAAPEYLRAHHHAESAHQQDGCMKGKDYYPLVSRTSTTSYKQLVPRRRKSFSFQDRPPSLATGISQPERRRACPRGCSQFFAIARQRIDHECCHLTIEK